MDEPTDDELRAILSGAARVAVVGASPDPDRPSHGIFAKLQATGYETIPVNPNAREVQGVPAVATLKDAGHPDLVVVFRRSEHAPQVARDAVAAKARALWLQVGVISDEAARIAREAGLAFVMDRCIGVEVARLRVRPARPRSP